MSFFASLGNALLGSVLPSIFKEAPKALGGLQDFVNKDIPSIIAGKRPGDVLKSRLSNVMGGVGRVAGDSILSASGQLQDKAISSIKGFGMPALLTDKAVSAIQQGVPMLTDKAISGVQKFTESPTFNNNAMSRIMPSYASYNNPALDAQLDRENTFNMNERKIPDIGPSMVDDQGTGSLNLANLGENETGVQIGKNAATGSTKMGSDQAQRIINDFIKNWINNPNRGKQRGRGYLGDTMDKIYDDYGRGKDEATRKRILKGIAEAVYNTNNKKIIRDWQDFSSYTDIIDEEFSLGDYEDEEYQDE
jgi:hypothetical protein